MLAAESLGSQVHPWSQMAGDRAWLWVPSLGWRWLWQEARPSWRCPGLDLFPSQGWSHRCSLTPWVSVICLLLAVGDSGGQACVALRTAGSHRRPRSCPDYSRWSNRLRFLTALPVEPRRPDCAKPTALDCTCRFLQDLSQRRAICPLASSDPETLQQLAVQNQVTALLWPDTSGQPCPVGAPKTRDPRIANTGSGRSWGPTS